MVMPKLQTCHGCFRHFMGSDAIGQLCIECSVNNWVAQAHSQSLTKESQMTATYVSVKLITAWPETKDGAEGYAVKYQSGYMSWCPKDVFEASNLKLSDAGLVDEAVVESFIKSVTPSVAGDRGAVAVLDTVTGFDVVKTATCAEAYAFDPVRAQTIATERAKNMLWEFLGFVVQWAKNGLKG